MQKKFLTAYWKDLLMANYEVDPEILRPYIPEGTELDSWEGKTYVSMVGFLFLDTKVLGIPIPLHQNFEEVNLRFYVRQKVDGEWRRGVVFIKEIVPRHAISWVANTFYGEHYQTLPMRHEHRLTSDSRHIEYAWKWKGAWQFLKCRAQLESEALVEGSKAEFITEHYWGYTGGPGKPTLIYQVEHPRWAIFSVTDFEFKCDVAGLYTAEFSPFLTQAPASVFLAEGSEVIVRRGERM